MLARLVDSTTPDVATTAVTAPASLRFPRPTVASPAPMTAGASRKAANWLYQ